MNKCISPFFWSFIGIFIIFLLGSLFHFAYSLSKKNSLIAFFVPVNESIWEHTKLAILPTFIWWITYLFFCPNIDINPWLTGLIISIITNVLCILLFYYFYTNALNFKSLWVDIGIFFLSCFIGQLIGYHVYNFTNGFSFYTCILLLIFIGVIYTFFTLFPPKLPLFQDSVTKKYGIE